MNSKNKILLTLLFLLVGFCLQTSAEDVATTLMRSTFKIQGNSSSGSPAIGTVFILGQPVSTNISKFVLVTAAHVLNDIKSEQATLFLRVSKGDSFEKLPFSMNIRSNGQPLWIQHSNADVAVMNIALPNNADVHLISTDLIATDKELKDFEVRPGDELLVLGFPLGAESNEAGFPVLRSGRIASYPITPMAITKTFLLDFQVFQGNSGGPVLLISDSRVYGGGTHAGRVQMMMGIVSQEMSKIEHVASFDEETLKKHPLALGVVVHAQFIGDLLTQLSLPQRN